MKIQAKQKKEARTEYFFSSLKSSFCWAWSCCTADRVSRALGDWSLSTDLILQHVHFLQDHDVLAEVLWSRHGSRRLHTSSAQLHQANNTHTSAATGAGAAVLAFLAGIAASEPARF
jgi:hypothetical protein